MKVKLIYSTQNYHKLVETTARVCYQSFHKDDEKSHNFIKAIMSKGHISVASVGNMVFEVKSEKDSVVEDLINYIIDLTTMHEITQFIKWTIPDEKKNPSDKFLISMNMLTFLDIYKERDSYEWASSLLKLIIKSLDKVPYLRWFYDKSVELPEIRNQYTKKGTPKLYEPIILDEDYTVLKALGLNDYELGIHATITANFITDRSASLQFWRHWSGGCELSQRYVERDEAEFRELIIDDTAIERLIDKTGMTEKELLRAINNIKLTLEQINVDIINGYESLLERCVNTGMHKGRAKEIARSILSNSITTQLIQCRPYRNWMHLFNLRDSNHAQREIQEDVIHLKRVLNEIGVPVT